MEWGCMQALIDFDGWRKWKNFAHADEGLEKQYAAAAAAGRKAGKKKNRQSLTLLASFPYVDGLIVLFCCYSPDTTGLSSTGNTWRVSLRFSISSDREGGRSRSLPAVVAGNNSDLVPCQADLHPSLGRLISDRLF
ncbi:hypothetical protein VTK73DRAFT_4128 [Phialemonium thermophilum]|uniref:Uncharacterized protein n=1 Tax=Phialemonium thermophilum TaxID=223376 RepID=A0ABR3VB99_9PEZI